MKFQSLAPDLQSWFRDMVKRGSSPEAAVQSLLAAGYQERYARDAAEAAFKALPKPAPPLAVHPPAPRVRARDRRSPRRPRRMTLAR